jgi:AbrB family looped-hinge helix DNA binding protein
MKISPQGQIRIPKKIMQLYGIKTGDYVEVDAEKGQIVLKPRKLIDPLQGWHWTKEWQQMEKEADNDLATGRYRDFDNLEDLLKDLHNED